MKASLLILAAAAMALAAPQPRHAPSAVLGAPLPKKTEVQVILDDMDPVEADQAPKANPPADPKTTAPKPEVKADSKPAPQADPDTDSKPAVTASATAPAAADPTVPAQKPATTLSVHLEKLQTSTNKVDPKKVTLTSPFPAKPLPGYEPPPGWTLDVSSDAKPFTREVEIAPGSTITLTIKPHVLIPVADGASAFSVREPGFQPEYQYCQKDTAGAVLTDSIEQLDDQARRLGNAIESLNQLLYSLPVPEAPKAHKAEPVKNR